MDTGYEVVSVTENVSYAQNGGTPQAIAAMAPSGKKVVGGGGHVVAAQNFDEYLPMGTHPQQLGGLGVWNAWEVRFVLPDDGLTYQARAYAICVNDDF